MLQIGITLKLMVDTVNDFKKEINAYIAWSKQFKANDDLNLDVMISEGRRLIEALVVENDFMWKQIFDKFSPKK